MAFNSSLEFLPEGIVSQELYPKICAMVDHIVQNFESQLEDTKYKFYGNSTAREAVIKEIIIELGFDYIRQVMDTLANFEFTQLLNFLSLINLLKGSRNGLELVLKFLGFDSIIYEWWETSPRGEADSFDLTIIVANSTVPNLNATVDKVKIFTRHYVYPKLNIVDFRFTVALASKNLTMAGFARTFYTGTIIQRI